MCKSLECTETLEVSIDGAILLQDQGRAKTMLWGVQFDLSYIFLRENDIVIICFAEMTISGTSNRRRCRILISN